MSRRGYIVTAVPLDADDARALLCEARRLRLPLATTLRRLLVAYADRRDVRLVDDIPARRVKAQYAATVQVEMPAAWDDALSMLCGRMTLPGLLRAALRGA